MAEGSTAQVDPLLILRSSIASSNPPVPTTSADASAATATDNLALATHLHFSSPSHQTYELSAPTRFVSSSTPVDLRSIYFAWQKKDVAIPDYIASAQQLTEELAAPGGAGGKVQNLVFVERLDLITWLEGASDESEYITPLEGEAGRAAAAGAAMVASGAVGGAAAVASAGGRAGKTIDPRLQEIYNGERKMGDRNTMLRGIKPTVRIPNPPYSARKTTHSDLTLLGFLPRPQIRRSLPRPHARPPLRAHRPSQQQHRPPPRTPPLLHPALHRLAPQEALPPPGPHHPALPFRLLLATDVEHQALPRIGHVHPPRPDLDDHHPARLAPAARHRRRPPAALHPRRLARPVQARLLGPRRRRLHHGPDVAVPQLPLEQPRRAVRPRAGRVSGVAWRGGPRGGEGLGQGGRQCGGR